MKKGNIDPYFELGISKDVGEFDYLVVDAELLLHKVYKKKFFLFNVFSHYNITPLCRNVLQFCKIQFRVKGRYSRIFVVNLSPIRTDKDFLYNTLGYEFSYIDTLHNEESYKNWLGVTMPKLHLCIEKRRDYCRDSIAPEIQALHVD